MLNWGDIISSNLENQLKKTKNELKLYMASYVMDLMCARREYPTLGWKWDPSRPSIHVYYKILLEYKYKEDYERICSGLFVQIYQTLSGEEDPCISPEGQALLRKYGNWYMTPEGVYLRIIGTTKAPH